MAARSAPTKTGGREATTGVIPGDYALSVGMPGTQAPRGWKWTPLTAVARLETGHTPSRNHPEYWDGDIPWIGIKDATGNHGLTIDDTIQHTTQAGIDNSSARVLPAHTVCLSRTASVGYVVVMGRPMATSQDFVNWVCSDALDYRYLKYVLLSERRSFLRFASGTTHQTIYFPEVKAFHVCLPPLPEQRAIAGVLGALDDKIEVNRTTARVLEGIARAVFTSWFVDFDPVRRRAASHPGSAAPLPADLAALFPTRLVDSPIGEVPEGWRASTLGEVIEIHDSKRIPLSSQQRAARPGPFRYYGAAGIVDHVDACLFDGTYLLLGEDGSVVDDAGHPVVQYVWGQFWVNNHAHVLTGTRGFSIEHLYLLAQGLHVKPFVTGAVQPKISQGNLKAIPIILAPEPVNVAFGTVVAPLFARLKVAHDQSATLAALRDALLPKLISGELRIADAEKIVGRAV